MKTEKEIEEILKEITGICKKHGVVLLGCCNSEGIYSEIVITDSPSAFCISSRSTVPWKDGSGDYQVEAIGLTSKEV